MPRAFLLSAALLLGTAATAVAGPAPCKHGKQCGDLGFAAWLRGEKTESVALHTEGCKLSYGPSCAALAQIRGDGLVGAADPAEGLRLNQKACKLGAAAACHNLAAAVHDGKGGKADPAAAKVHARRACELGWSKSCDVLDAWNGVPAPSPPLDAAARCQRDDSDACVARGLQLEDDSAGTPDLAGAGVAYERACKLGNQEGCAAAAALQEARDPKGAAARYRRACDLGSAFGCAQLAWLLEGGRGVKRDHDQALFYLELACPAHSDRDGEACAWLAADLGGLVQYGLFGQANPVAFDRAMAFASRGCEEEVGAACEVGADVLEQVGRTAEALPFLAAACARGEAGTCERGAAADKKRAVTWADCGKGVAASCQALTAPPAKAPPAKAPAAKAPPAKAPPAAKASPAKAPPATP